MENAQGKHSENVQYSMMMDLLSESRLNNSEPKTIAKLQMLEEKKKRKKKKKKVVNINTALRIDAVI